MRHRAIDQRRVAAALVLAPEGLGKGGVRERIARIRRDGAAEHVDGSVDVIAAIEPVQVAAALHVQGIGARRRRAARGQRAAFRRLQLERQQRRCRVGDGVLCDRFVSQL